MGSTSRKLHRSATDKWLAGVCSGVGEFFDVDPNVIRLVAVFMGVATGFAPLLVTYAVAWFILPQGQQFDSDAEFVAGVNGV